MGTKSELKIVALLLIIIAVFALLPLMMVRADRQVGGDWLHGEAAGLQDDQGQAAVKVTGKFMQEDYDYYDFYRKHEDIPSPGVGH
ncbi:hypothetical protein Nepgr_006874 [Nepenthes gracilis]|uniref:Uncharacterized protein n=1 Tax=Nepenthes gracilis TaxID=150966 RepID=A0AAD3S666_NEPGR|nr:hypothetical protein Nepgr_006874 [Nepenthes gracilis]